MGDVVGIDLGTTYSAVAIVEEGQARLIPSRAGHRLTPSMVGFLPSGTRVIGQAALALAYGLQQGFRGKALVFDLGGGTFDVSVLQVEKQIFEVLATGGDPLLGGVDFDDRVVSWLLEQLPSPFHDLAMKDKVSMQRLR